MTVLITGAAGFIGAHLSRRLLEAGHNVIGVDHCRSFPLMSKRRLTWLVSYPNFSFECFDVLEPRRLERLCIAHPEIRVVVHLAACGGVRRSSEEPEFYVRNNIQSHIAVLEACRKLPALEHILYASSSAVYGQGAQLPFREDRELGRPASFYAVTKRTNELTAETYAHLYGFPQTGLRFFTVYGPWGRPDMAYYKFARALRDRQPVTLWNGRLLRDFTYIDDAIEAISMLLSRPPDAGSAQIFNIASGESRPVRLLVELLAKALAVDYHIAGDAPPVEDLLETKGDIEAIRLNCGWNPTIGLEIGVSYFSEWFHFSR